jgi:hypothetical protein
MCVPMFLQNLKKASIRVLACLRLLVLKTAGYQAMCGLCAVPEITMTRIHASVALCLSLKRTYGTRSKVSKRLAEHKTHACPSHLEPTTPYLHSMPLVQKSAEMLGKGNIYTL